MTDARGGPVVEAGVHSFFAFVRDLRDSSEAVTIDIRPNTTAQRSRQGVFALAVTVSVPIGLLHCADCIDQIR